MNGENGGEIALISGVRPCGWTELSGSFDRLLGVLILELHRAEIAERGMKAFAVVDLVEEPRKVGGDVLERLVGGEVDSLDLQRLHEALRLGVVIWIGAAAHRADQAMGGQQLAVDLRRVLRTAIGMMNAAGDRRSIPDCRLQCRDRDAGVHRSADGVADHLTRPGIQDCGQVNEAARNGDVGEVRDPELVRALGNKILGQVGVDRPGMVAVRRDNVAAPPLGLKIIVAHESTQLLVVHHHTLMTQRRPDPPVAVALELVANRANPGEEFVFPKANGRLVVERGSREAHQLAPSSNGDGAGPVTTEVIALFGRGACFKAPFSSSISSAWRPTIRSRAAILASYSWIRSAACTPSSKAPASNLPTQIRISWRETSWRLESACNVSPAMNSSATWRLNAALWDRCLVMTSILRKPSKGGQFKPPNLSTRRGALHCTVSFDWRCGLAAPGRCQKRHSRQRSRRP